MTNNSGDSSQGFYGGVRDKHRHRLRPHRLLIRKVDCFCVFGDEVCGAEIGPGSMVDFTADVVGTWFTIP
jgi:hypothetical protein